MSSVLLREVRVLLARGTDVAYIRCMQDTWRILRHKLALRARERHFGYLSRLGFVG